MNSLALTYVSRLVGVLAIMGALITRPCYASEQGATNAAIADSVSTMVAMGVGATEANPLGLATLALKMPILAYAQTLPVAERESLYRVAAPIWEGATANNLCVFAVLVSGGTASPLCAAIGLAWCVYALSHLEPESEPFIARVELGPEVAFWQACQDYRRESGETFHCVYRMTP